VEDDVKLERTLHTAFGDHRVRSSREFFRLDPYRAKVIIELLATEDVTPREDLFEDAESAEAVERATRSRGRYNFIENGIPVGATLEYASDPAITCQVADESNVLFNGQLTSLSKAAVMANASRGGKARALTGPIWWLYQGETLGSIRDQREAEED
jgi:hypothetical protein